MWDIALTYKILIDRLEEQKAIAENYPNPEYFKINTNLGQDKLNKYYIKLNETLAYYILAILNPAFYQGYFKSI